MLERRWCVAWDGSPFVIKIDSTHLTRRAAERELARHHYRRRLFVTTVEEARRLDGLVWERTQAGGLPETRFDIQQA